jgi:predicted O-methyltransferase YrrM
MERQVIMMTDKLASFLVELEAFSKKNDAETTDHSRKMRNIKRETGQFLLLLIRAMKAKRVLEIGTSNGYSTLWLAHAIQALDGKVTTLDHSQYKVDLARANFARAELGRWIDSRLVDAGDFLKQQASDSLDLIFLDSEREEYVGWWADLQRVLARGGLFVADNAVSHAKELEAFIRTVHQTKGYLTSLVPVGNGELLILKET